STPAATPTRTPSPAPTTPPTAVPTAAPPGCVELTRNGGFETGFAPWRAGASRLPPRLVTAPVFEGVYAMQLGSQSENRYAYSSVRQTVTVPPGRPRTVISFWTYTWAESLSGGDQQQFVLLGAGDQVWAKPWSVLEDARTWEQHIFDVIGAGGLTFDLYFNVINDGVGGRTAMFLDQVHAWACTPDAYPEALIPAALEALPEDEAAITTETPAPPGTPEVGIAPLAAETPSEIVETVPSAPQGALAVGQTPLAKATTVSIITATPPPAITLAAPIATATLIPRAPQAVRTPEARPTGLLGRLSNLLSEPADRIRLLVVALVAAFLLLVGVIGWLVGRSYM
ncbi:MAG: hypothetical protein N2204_00425, partial [Anaerolineae bacterium]|nr:hypothetical protein [Anaerolineae bacterium]